MSKRNVFALTVVLAMIAAACTSEARTAVVPRPRPHRLHYLDISAYTRRRRADARRRGSFGELPSIPLYHRIAPATRALRRPHRSTGVDMVDALRRGVSLTPPCRGAHRAPWVRRPARPDLRTVPSSRTRATCYNGGTMYVTTDVALPLLAPAVRQGAAHASSKTSSCRSSSPSPSGMLGGAGPGRTSSRGSAPRRRGFACRALCRSRPRCSACAGTLEPMPRSRSSP